ncbi:FG-GAP-like repeat-containing protein [Streptomyces sp. NBC_01565]|uniref:FG-GAP-like repeat-containing protein n=1 Tax=unclassified Streptomyces TaxID=2593676 RepID=UPI002259CBC4|nr:FG-GAP-like repeat-containing protein [Streptomyces sp. NBC_01565]MCX4540015.1 FG-GAP-like repeat-containing protein [Streptomyces sp. NBC_01565]
MQRRISGAVALALAGGLAATGVVAGAGAASAAGAGAVASVAGAGETPVGAQAWTRVSKKFPNRSYWNAAEDLRVGNEGPAQGVSRAYLRLDTSVLKGATVSKATLRIGNTAAASCTAKPVELWSVGAVSAKTTWKNQPAKGVKLATVNGAKGPEGCAAGDLEFEASALIKEAAAKNLATVTVGLFASDESDSSAWKRFAPASARLETTVARPAPPVISSPEFPEAVNGVPAQTGKARTPGTFTFGTGGATNIEKIVYWSESDPRQVTVAPGAGASITPTTSGTHTIYAYSVDKAGNRSDQATYLFYALGNGGVRDAAGDLNGDGLRDLWSLDADGRLRFSAGRGDGTFAAPVDGGATFAPGTRIAAGGDWGEDGYNDLLVLEYNENLKAKQLRLFPNDGLGVVRPVDSIELSVFCPVKDPDAGCVRDDETWTGDNHWSDAEDIADAGDFNGDGDPDLLVRQGAKLWAYPGSRSGYLDMGGSPVLVGDGGWDAAAALVPGDTDGDGVADLWVRDDATGDLFAVKGVKGANGQLDPKSWGTGSRVKIGSGVARSAYPTLLSAGDLNRDGLADLAAVGADGKLVVFRGTAAGIDATPVSAG